VKKQERWGRVAEGGSGGVEGAAGGVRLPYVGVGMLAAAHEGRS